MKVRRDIGSIPVRTAEETWAQILTLVHGSDSVDFAQLQAANAVLCSLITDEVHAEHPFTFAGVGSRLVLYLRFDRDAIEAGMDVIPIDWCPTAGDWTLYAPCDTENLSWARDALAERSPRIVLHDPDSKPADAAPSASRPLTANWGELDA